MRSCDLFNSMNIHPHSPDWQTQHKYSLLGNPDNEFQVSIFELRSIFSLSLSLHAACWPNVRTKKGQSKSRVRVQPKFGPGNLNFNLSSITDQLHPAHATTLSTFTMTGPRRVDVIPSLRLVASTCHLFCFSAQPRRLDKYHILNPVA